MLSESDAKRLESVPDGKRGTDEAMGENETSVDKSEGEEVKKLKTAHAVPVRAQASTVVRTLVCSDGSVLKEGDLVTLDGTNGVVYLGSVPMVDPQADWHFELIIQWADKYKRMQVHPVLFLLVVCCLSYNNSTLFDARLSWPAGACQRRDPRGREAGLRPRR
jgi:hypothetical protein